MDGELLRIEDPSQASVLTLRSGTELRIPARCFVNEAGENVTGPVELRFLEFHEAAEIIAAGIPMYTFGPGGRKEWLQTAGMFDIRGSSSGKAVAVAQGRSIAVSFVSRVGGAYDFWIFNEAQGVWLNQSAGGSPQPIRVQSAAADALVEQEVVALTRATASPPRQPQPTPESERLIFSDLDYRQCPDLQGLQQLVLTYAGDDPAKDPKNNKWITKPGIWFKKELKPTREPGIYQLTLMGDSLYAIPVKQALSGDNMEEAMAAYREALAEHHAKLELLDAKREILGRQDAFRREMSISGFGLYNYDVIWESPDAIPLAADFDFGNLPEEVKKLVTVYLITGDRRTVISLPHYDWRNFRYSPGSDNTLFALLPNDKIAMFTRSDFKAAQGEIESAKGKSYTFRMRLKDQQPNSLGDLRNLLEEADI